ncbi:MAG: AAA family ATPase [Candidatus Daviesbacteria bacterium]|nr:AAA family ATPase [Candidatus Daviesbacteria bacterium]
MDSAQNPIANLKVQVSASTAPLDLKDRLTNQLVRIEKVVGSEGYSLEYDREVEYIKFMLTLPFEKGTQDILDLKRAGQILDQNHYGLKSAKDRILEYLAVLILNAQSSNKMRSQVLAFIGLVGSGKTSLAYSIAESLGRKIIRIPFGGLGSVRELRGESRLKSEAESGSIMKLVAQLGVNNPVILLDEIDRVAIESRSDVMGVLVELLDPEQNNGFLDHYVDYPFDLSKALFIATANNTANIATAVMDRLEVIEMPAYSDDEKIVIGKNFILPRALKESGLKEGLIIIEEGLWPQVVRPLGYDAGIRSLQRHIQTIVRRVARQVVEGQSGPFQLTGSNIGQYLN